MSEKIDKKRLNQIFGDDEEQTTPTPTPQSAPVSKEDRMKNLLDNIEDEAPVVDEKELAQVTFDSLSVDEKINKLYLQALEKAKHHDEDGIMTTYVEDSYNPATTTLDKTNLLFNLMILTRLQEIGIMSFHFDEDHNQPYHAEYALTYDFWNDIMDSSMDKESKYAKVLDKNFRVTFYKSMFQTIVSSADKTSYNNTKRKWNSILADDDAPTQTLEEGVLDEIRKKTVEGSLVMITPDLKEFISFDVENKEKLSGEEQEITFLGEWEGRLVYELNVNKISYLKGFRRGAFFFKGGNKFIINPTKPIGYVNVLENPFLVKPSLKMYVNMNFKFFNSTTTFLRIEDM